jgi:hypothetical protein
LAVSPALLLLRLLLLLLQRLLRVWERVLLA